jgi:Coenzyme PQQ synthesis protein D (PqqD)
MLNSALISRHPDLLETALDNEVVLISIERGSYYGLEATAKRIWQLLEQPQSRDQLVEALCREYDAQPEVIAKDLDVFLHKMLENGVVTAE